MSGGSYTPPGTPIPDGKKRKRKRRTPWAEKEPVRSINVPLTVARDKRLKWIQNALTDLVRQISSQRKVGEKRVTRRQLGRLVAGATDRELIEALYALVVNRAVRRAGLEDFLAADAWDNETFWYPEPVKPKGRDIRRVFYRGELVTCYWLSKLPENIHRLTHQDLRKRIIGNNWTAEMALIVPRKVEMGNSTA